MDENAVPNQQIEVETPFSGVKPLIASIEENIARSPVPSENKKNEENIETLSIPIAPLSVIDQSMPPMPPVIERRLTRSSAGGNLSSAMTAKLLEKVTSNTAPIITTSTATLVTNKRKSGDNQQQKLQSKEAPPSIRGGTSVGHSRPSTATTAKIVKPAAPVAKKIHVIQKKTAPAVTSVYRSTSTSASSAREAARLAKEAAIAERVAKVADLKAKWKTEKETKVMKNTMTREAQQTAIRRRNDMAAKQRRAAHEKNRAVIEQAAFERRQELNDKLAADKMQSVLLEEEARESKRESLAARLNSWRLEKSYEQISKEAEQSRHQSEIEDRYDTWQAKQTFKAKEANARRQSVALRLDQWRKEKAIEEVQQSEQHEQAAMEAEIKQAVDEDIRAYREECDFDRRNSLAFRLDKARVDADHTAAQKAMENELAMEALRLAEQDRQDVRNANEEMIAARRQSLAFRNERARQWQEQCICDKEIQATAEHESRLLTTAAWNDVKQYQEQCREHERQEIAQKINESRRQQEESLEAHSVALSLLHEDLESKRMDWLEVHQAKQEEVRKSRKSISMRLNSWRKQRVEEAKESSKRAARADEDARLRELDRELMLSYQREVEADEVADRLNSGMIM